MIEVEQKFIITSETREQLRTLGAQKTATKSVCDVYCDTPDHSLMRNDHWLRKRDGKWELKYRPSILKESSEYAKQVSQAKEKNMK